MQRDFPFLAHRVHYSPVVPSPVVQLIDRDEKGNESLVDCSVKEYYEKNPLATKCFSLQELLDAGQELKQVNPAIYESNDASDYGFTSEDVLEAAKQLKEQMSNPINSEE